MPVPPDLLLNAAHGELLKEGLLMKSGYEVERQLRIIDTLLLDLIRDAGGGVVSRNNRTEPPAPMASHRISDRKLAALARSAAQW
jgi:hypothetical protein